MTPFFRNNILLVILPLWAFATNARANQPKTQKRLLYAVETINCGAVNQAYIQACLSEMTFRDQQTLPVFEKITYLNSLTDLIDLEKRIYSYALFFNPQLHQHSELSSTRLIRDSLLSTVLIGNNVFLLIKIRRDESGNYSYNFTSTEQRLDNVTTTADLNDLKFTSYDALLPAPSENLHRLRTALYNVIPDANRKPRCKLQTNAAVSENQYWFAAGDTLKLQTMIADDDSEFFSYNWQVTGNRQNSVPDTGKDRQAIKIHDTGLYYFIVSVSDGINVSAPDTARINVVVRPEITAVKDIDHWIPVPMKMYYQPHFAMQEYKTIRLKSKRLFLNQELSPSLTFTFEEEGNPNSKSDTAFQHQFRTEIKNGYYSIWLLQRKKEAGQYNFAVTVTDHGLQSSPHAFSFKFRKASRVYFQVGHSILHYSGGPLAKKVYSNQLGLGFFIHPKIHFDYMLQFPAIDNTHPQFGQNQTLKYPGHRFTISRVIPVFAAQEALITADMLLTTFRYPELSKNREAALGFGLTARLFYLHSFFGVYLRSAYVFVRPTANSDLPFGAFIFTVGCSVQPVKMRKSENRS